VLLRLALQVLLHTTALRNAHALRRIAHFALKKGTQFSGF
jgi:hypothetical protein